MVTVPCDSPLFPQDLVERLAHALEAADAEVAMARTGDQVQPVFTLMKASLLDSLVRFTQSGGRKIDLWTALHRTVDVNCDDESAFFNANTLDELRSIEQRHV